MLTLDLTNAPCWHDLATGVRVQLRPLTTALMVATRNDPAVEAIPEEASPIRYPEFLCKRCHRFAPDQVVEVPTTKYQ
ncbi:MAG: hypothetical protein DI613_11165 [Kocuria rhizophila]|nr:MAG: hypothetical protein DI613_11165 [Kocuria rhizophila]